EPVVPPVPVVVAGESLRASMGMFPVGSMTLSDPVQETARTPRPRPASRRATRWWWLRSIGSSTASGGGTSNRREVWLLSPTYHLRRMSNYQVWEVPLGVREREVKRLQKAKVYSPDELLQQGAPPKAGAALTKRTGLPPATILTLVRRADLLRLD